MSEALYRKYRPQTFEDVVGQTHIERTLKNAIESDKVSHAYLFCGPRGTGKTTTARLLAKALLCEQGPTPSPDGTCEQCLAIAEGTHPDVNEMDAASRTGVENVREEIIGRVQYAPTRGRYKIYIIDEVHMLSTAAFNALLKTLEEPPDHVVFILCTTDPQKVPETIHSRCQRFDFHRLSNEEIVSRLGAVCMAEGVQFEGDALDLIAHRAQGGMRDALTTLEQLIAFGNGAVTMDVARNVLGSLDTDDMTAIVNAIAARDAAACFTWVSEYIETGADLAQFTRDLASYVRDLYVLGLTDGAVAVDAPASSRDAMTNEAKLFGPDRLAYILRVLGDLSSELRSSTNARLSFEIALTRMVRPESDLTLESLAARIEALEARLAQGVPVAPAVSAAQGASAVQAQGVPAAQPSASVPASSAGYKPVTEPSQPAAPSPDAAVAAMSKAAAFRAQMEQRRKGGGAATPRPAAPVAPAAAAAASSASTHAPAVPTFDAPAPAATAPSFASAHVSAPAPAAPAPAPAPASASSAATVSSAVPSAAPASAPMPSSSPAPAAAKPAGASPSASATAQSDVPASAQGAPDAIKAKLLNPAALQRGWQAALAELKRQRAVYAALMQSARVVANPDGSGVSVEFSKENDFAYSAAQKPDVSAALAAALEHAFGGPVPFQFTQGGGVAAAVMAAAASTGAGHAPASTPSASGPAAQFASGRAMPNGPSGQAAPAFRRPHSTDAGNFAPFDGAPVGGAGNGDGSSAAPSFARPKPNFARAASNVPAQPAQNAAGDRGAASNSQAPVFDDDVVPYSDVDVASYIHEGDSYGASDSPYFAPWDGAQQGQKASADTPAAASTDAAAAHGARPAQSNQASSEPMHATHATVPPALGVAGPAPVDPYLIGKKLGFDSMPAPKRRPKGTVVAKGWPGVGDGPAADSAGALGVSGSGAPSEGASASAPGATAQSGAGAPGSAQAAPTPDGAASSVSGAAPSSTPTSRPFIPFDPNTAVDPNKPNPFAGRKMPSGVGKGGSSPSPFPSSRPVQPTDGGMDIADIFGAFGVSMDNVQEE